MQRDLLELQKNLGITFKNANVLMQAFTHSSYVNEHRMKNYRDNERLEYLGDAVLELTVSEFLFHSFPDREEGELTKLRASIVCEPSLVTFADALQFGSYILLGKGEELTGGRTRPSLLADVFESFIGALYLDQGLNAVKSFLGKHMFPKITSANRIQNTDHKTRLQEYIQQHGMGALEYRISDERGPAHEREFVSEVYLDSKLMGTGSGRSKKDAEQQAASEALSKLGV